MVLEDHENGGLKFARTEKVLVVQENKEDSGVSSYTANISDYTLIRPNFVRRPF